MTVLKTVQLSCLNCSYKFSTQKVVSTNEFGGKRTDFHTKAAGANPLPWQVYTCPCCGFSLRAKTWDDKEDEFKPNESTSNKISIHLTPLVPPLSSNIVIPGSTKYEWAARILQWESSGPGTTSDAYKIADSYQHAAWCCVEEKDTEAERYFRGLAAEWFITALHTFGEVEEDDRATIYYLIGENFRRMGKIGRAHEWFGAIPEVVNDEKKQQWVIEAANQQAHNPKEWFG